MPNLNVVVLLKTSAELTECQKLNLSESENVIILNTYEMPESETSNKKTGKCQKLKMSENEKIFIVIFLP